MKALTIKQPWASLIAHGIKDVENRTWRTKYRGRIYVHVSAAKFIGKAHPFTPLQLSVCQNAQQNGLLPELNKLPYSAIIGEVDIVDCVLNHPSIWAEKSETAKAGNQEFYKKGSVTWNWILANPILYDEPILNVKGKLSFWPYSILT